MVSFSLLVTIISSIEMFKSFSYGIAALVIFIGSLLVFVTMMGSVNERTREIGIFRAIGFRRGHVMQIILLEEKLLLRTLSRGHKRPRISNEPNVFQINISSILRPTRQG